MPSENFVWHAVIWRDLLLRSSGGEAQFPPSLAQTLTFRWPQRPGGEFGKSTSFSVQSIPFLNF